MVLEFFRAIGDLIHRRSTPQTPPARRLLLMIIVGTLPLFLILPLKDAIESLYYNTVFIAFALLVTGLLLFLSDRAGRGRKTEKTATMGSFLLTIADVLAVQVSEHSARCGGVLRQLQEHLPEDLVTDAL